MQKRASVAFAVSQLEQRIGLLVRKRSYRFFLAAFLLARRRLAVLRIDSDIWSYVGVCTEMTKVPPISLHETLTLSLSGSGLTENTISEYLLGLSPL